MNKWCNLIVALLIVTLMVTTNVIALSVSPNVQNEENDDEINIIFEKKDTICKYVSNRSETLTNFAKSNDIVIFVAGRNSSNGKSLFTICNNANPNTHFIENIFEIEKRWFSEINRIGITGATSTPQWYLVLVKEEIEKMLKF